MTCNSSVNLLSQVKKGAINDLSNHVWLMIGLMISDEMSKVWKFTDGRQLSSDGNISHGPLVLVVWQHHPSSKMVTVTKHTNYLKYPWSLYILIGTKIEHMRWKTRKICCTTHYHIHTISMWANSNKKM
jgi:hypothetical protein